MEFRDYSLCKRFAIRPSLACSSNPPRPLPASSFPLGRQLSRLNCVRLTPTVDPVAHPACPCNSSDRVERALSLSPRGCIEPRQVATSHAQGSQGYVCASGCLTGPRAVALHAARPTPGRARRSCTPLFLFLRGVSLDRSPAGSQGAHTVSWHAGTVLDFPQAVRKGHGDRRADPFEHVGEA